LLAEFVSLFTSHFQVEHQILDVESQLSECFLDKGQDSSSPFHGIDDSRINRFHVGLIFFRESGNRSREIHKLARKIILATIRKSIVGVHLK